MKLLINKSLSTAVLLLGLIVNVNADDIDILDASVIENANMLFVMDLSGSMDWDLSGVDYSEPSGSEPSRLEVLRGAFQDLMTDITSDPEYKDGDLNIGLSVFSGNAGLGADVAHGITYPVSSLTGATAQSILSTPSFVHPGASYMPSAAANDSHHYLELFTNDPTIWDAGGSTPIVGALLEASLYFRGEKVLWGRFPPNDIRSAHPSTYTGLISDDTATYKSPITECTNNGIVLLSDGFPTENNSANLVSNLIGTSYANGCSSGSDDRRCGSELAEFMFKEDGNPDIDGTQNVLIYTVGLSLPDTSPASIFLQEIADKGQGKDPGDGIFINANNRAELVAAFKVAFADLEGKARSFSSPSYSVDTSTLLTHGNFVYVPVFDRGTTVWPGNLKKYKLERGILLDALGNPAIDTVSGSLLDTAKDYWATTASTDAITSGGAAKNLPAADSRKIYTDAGISSFPASLTSSSLNLANANITPTLLGNPLITPAYRTELINYIRGKKSNGTSRFHMGDIVHSKPVQLSIAGGRKIIFIGTNEGYLHAINDSNGREAFAFMPGELLKNIDKQYSNIATDKHIYGVDGPITLWIDESANANTSTVGNGVLDSADGEKAYLFFGLRRGGKAYYALNVTNPDSPVLEWKKDNSDFSSLAHTWSQPVVAQLRWKPNDRTKPVLIFGGGYSDDASGNEIVGTGNAAYIVDASDGSEVWSTVTAESEYPGDLKIMNAVPSRIRVLDTDRNGSIDRLYFGDTGANLWRVDLNVADYSGIAVEQHDISKARVHKFAILGGISNRKFFEEPDVATFTQGGKLVSTIAIGSGDRTNPLDASVDDRFFVLYDKEVLTLATASPITASELDTIFPIPSSRLVATNFKGWNKDLTSISGEKVLSTAVTYQNKVMFTTFGTTSMTRDSCSTRSENQARLYVLDLISGQVDTDTMAAKDEILGTPTIYFEELVADDGTPCDKGNCIRKAVIRVGKAESFDLPPVPAGSAQPDSLPRVYWIDNQE